MAVDYQTLFSDIGSLVRVINFYDATALELDRDAIQDQFDDSDMNHVVTGLFQTFDSAIQNVASFKNALAQIAEARLRDRDTIINELNLPSDSIQDVIPALITQMVADAQTVDATTCSIGTVSANSGNVGTGLVFVSKVLDGVTEPSFSYPAHLKYNGVNSELCINETMTLFCDSDEDSGGSEEGSESFTLNGEIGSFDVWSNLSEGSGNGPQITVLNSNTIIANKDFEDFTSNLPDSWDLDLGTVVTHVDDDSTAGNFFRGTTALKLLGTGAIAEIKLSQSIDPSLITPRKRYMLAVAMKATATIAAGNLLIEMQGTGLTTTDEVVAQKTWQISGTPAGGNSTLTVAIPGRHSVTTGNIAYDATAATVQTALRALSGLESVVVSTSAGSPPDQTLLIAFHGIQGNPVLTANISGLTGGSPVSTITDTVVGTEGERIYLIPGALPTTWSVRNCYWTAPASLPDDLEIVISWSNTPTAAKNTWIDSIAFGPVDYFGGVSTCLVAGQTQFIRGDKFTYSLSTNEEGTFQTFFRKFAKVQIPSNTAGGETLSDSLAE